MYSHFFNILNTIYPEYLAKILAHADQQRFATDGEKMKNETIEISEYWAEQLKDMVQVGEPSTSACVEATIERPLKASGVAYRSGRQ